MSEFNVEAEINHPSQPANFRTLTGVLVDGVVLQQNKAESIELYAIARSGLKDKYKLLESKLKRKFDGSNGRGEQASMPAHPILEKHRFMMVKKVWPTQSTEVTSSGDIITNEHSPPFG